jgi:hypothetical protein
MYISMPETGISMRHVNRVIRAADDMRQLGSMDASTTTKRLRHERDFYDLTDL